MFSPYILYEFNLLYIFKFLCFFVIVLYIKLAELWSTLVSLHCFHLLNKWIIINNKNP